MNEPTTTSSPALGAGIWPVLLRNEWFKIRKRLAFWLSVGFFAFITFMVHGEDFFDRDEDFVLPEAWSGVFGGDSVILLIFAGICVIMLVSTEFTWRTARQNVIDGLSKAQWYWGKTFVLPIVGLAFVGAKVLIPGVLALIRTDMGAASGALLPASMWAATGGLFVAFLVMGALGLFLALAVRNTGGAMAVWFLWIVPGEQLILPGLTQQFFPEQAGWLAYLPFTAAQNLLPWPAYDEATFQSIVEAALEAGETAPNPIELGQPMWTAIAWTVALIVIGFIWFRRRDL